MDTIGHALDALGLPRDGAALAEPAATPAARGDKSSSVRAPSGEKATPPPSREGSGRFGHAAPLDVRTAPGNELSTQSLEDCSLLEAASLRQRASSGAVGGGGSGVLGAATGAVGDSVATGDTYASAELLSSVEMDAHSLPVQAEGA